MTILSMRAATLLDRLAYLRRCAALIGMTTRQDRTEQCSSWWLADPGPRAAGTVDLPRHAQLSTDQDALHRLVPTAVYPRRLA